MSSEKEVVRFGPLAASIPNGVRRGDAIYLSGQVSIDEKGQVVAPGDMAAQVRQAYANVIETLEKFGATMDDVVDETWFVTDMQAVMGDMKGVFGARTEAFGKDPEACQTLIGVDALAFPDLLVEIKVIAHV